MKIEKFILSKFGKNFKDILDYMSSNYTIIIDKGGRQEDYACHILISLLSRPNSILNCSIKCTEY